MLLSPTETLPVVGFTPSNLYPDRVPLRIEWHSSACQLVVAN
jgi:hypothetical protein